MAKIKMMAVTGVLVLTVLMAATVPASAEGRAVTVNGQGTGTIRLREKQDALVVPSEAVQFNRGTHYVFVREDGLFRSVPVELGALDGGATEIVSGVEEGMVVATGGSHVLKAEMQITAAMR